MPAPSLMPTTSSSVPAGEPGSAWLHIWKLECLGGCFHLKLRRAWQLPLAAASSGFRCRPRAAAATRSAANPSSSRTGTARHWTAPASATTPVPAWSSRLWYVGVGKTARGQGCAGNGGEDRVVGAPAHLLAHCPPPASSTPVTVGIGTASACFTTFLPCSCCRTPARAATQVGEAGKGPAGMLGPAAPLTLEGSSQVVLHPNFPAPAGNYYSNKRWCCGEASDLVHQPRVAQCAHVLSCTQLGEMLCCLAVLLVPSPPNRRLFHAGDMDHFDISVWAFEKLADLKWGVIAL